MATLERRLQILLDEDRYTKIADEAARTGRSVAAIIREAIDARLDADEHRRRAAARRLLSYVNSNPTPEPDWSETKDAMERDVADRWT